MMIEDQQVTLDGRVYVWSHDPDARPADCWSWAEEKTYMVPATGLISQLNRLFIEQWAADVSAVLDESQLLRFCEILELMGATDEEITTFGLQETLVA